SLTYHDGAPLRAGGYVGSGAFSRYAVSRGYDTLLPPTTLVAQYSTTPLLHHSFTFDAASRLQTVSDGTDSVTYSHLANSPLIGQITFQHAGATKMTTTRQYDYLNRLLSISSLPSSSLPHSYAYAYNAADQRSRVDRNDSSYWLYQYDALGQVRSGKK